MTQERIQKAKSKQTEQQEEPQDSPSKSDRAEELKAHSDELLDEIDSVLEQNAAEFVKGYVQKGGE